MAWEKFSKKTSRGVIVQKVRTVYAKAWKHQKTGAEVSGVILTDSRGRAGRNSWK